MGWFWWWPFGQVPEVSARQLDGLLRDRAGAPQLVDVRTRTEWRAGHIAGAIHVPISSLEARVPVLQLDGARPVVAICRSAHRSVPAVRVLHKHGFDKACQLQGGMLAWLDAGLPVVIDADRQEG